MPRVTDKQLAHLKHHGYAIVPRFLSPRELKQARAGMLQYFPSPEELAVKPLRYAAMMEAADFLQIEFPYDEQVFNHLALNPRILDFITRLLGSDEITLSRSSLWAKYAGAGEYEQELHVDYEGNTLVVPRDDGDYRQVNIILYYSDVDETLGPTEVLSQQHSKDDPLWPPFRSRDDWPHFYEHAKQVHAKAGDMLIFSMRTFHRATAITADFGARFTQHLVYRSRQHGFQGHELWSSHGEKHELHRFIEMASPRQREALGFPKVGDPYWNEVTLAGVKRRYPKMDLRPYRK
ncbi:MAG: phytanoyl-CoA dioxygenase family protein [Phycisphaeraceae bacterium]